MLRRDQITYSDSPYSKDKNIGETCNSDRDPSMFESMCYLVIHTEVCTVLVLLNIGQALHYDEHIINTNTCMGSIIIITCNPDLPKHSNGSAECIGV